MLYLNRSLFPEIPICRVLIFVVLVSRPIRVLQYIDHMEYTLEN
jgi:hypothetical protein